MQLSKNWLENRRPQVRQVCPVKEQNQRLAAALEDIHRDSNLVRSPKVVITLATVARLTSGNIMRNYLENKLMEVRHNFIMK